MGQSDGCDGFRRQPLSAWAWSVFSHGVGAALDNGIGNHSRASGVSAEGGRGSTACILHPALLSCHI